MIPDGKKLASPYDTLAIRRVGFYAGRCVEYNNQNDQTFLFLRIPDDTLRNNIQQYLMSIDWSYEDTVGPRSVSKQQYIEVLNLFN